MQQKIPGIRYEIGLYSKRIGVFRGLSATIQQSSQKTGTVYPVHKIHRNRFEFFVFSYNININNNNEI